MCWATPSSTAHRGAIEITIGAHPPSGWAEVHIRDYGIGIPADQQVRLFQRFARADNAQAYGIPGTGLGLYVCRELVERHGGRIWLESHPGAGTTVSIRLPLLTKAAAGAEQGAETPAAEAASEASEPHAGRTAADA
jgi:signal transduction histidine kinase